MVWGQGANRNKEHWYGGKGQIDESNPKLKNNRILTPTRKKSRTKNTRLLLILPNKPIRPRAFFPLSLIPPIRVKNG